MRLTVAFRSRAIAALVVAACASVGGLLVAVAVARTSTVDETGRFGVAVAALVLVTSLVRSAVADPLIATDQRDALAELGRASWMGVAGALVVVVAGALLGSEYLLLGGIAVHGLAVRDCVRAVLVARGRSRLAVRVEVTWMLITAVGAGGAIVGIWSGPVAFAVWSGSGAFLGYVVAALTGTRIRPDWRATPIPDRRSIAFSGDTLIGTGVAQLVTWIAAAIGGLGVAAALRGAGTLAGPVTVGLTAARAVLIPRCVSGLGAGRGLRPLIADSARMCLLALPALALLSFLPEHIGRSLLGATWPLVAPILPLTAIELLFQLVAAVPEAGHRALGAGRRIVLMRCVTALIRIPVVVAVAPHGLHAVVLAAAAITAVGAGLQWTSLAQLCRRTTSSVQGPPSLIRTRSTS